MDQGDNGGLERVLGDIKGRVEAFEGDGAVVAQVQGGGDDHYVVEVKANAHLVLILDQVQGLPFWKRAQRSPYFLASTR